MEREGVRQIVVYATKAKIREAINNK